MNDEKKFRWNAKSLRIVRERYVRDGPKALAELLGTTPASVTAKAKRLGVRPKQETKPYEWTEDMLATLREIYPTADKATLTERLGLPLYVIRQKARKLGIKNIMRTVWSGASRSERNTSCDIRFFDTWTPDMAYVLGFLFADGSITKRQCDVVIGLADSDRCVLNWIKGVLKSTRPLYFRKAHKDKKGHNHQRSAYLTIGSKIIVKRLMELGMMPLKTYRNDPFPAVPDEHMPHFIRGYFDGDGTARGKFNGWVSVGFIGTPKFIQGLRDALCRSVELSFNMVIPEGDNNARVSWGAVEDVRKFRDYIYPSGYSFCLERKKDVLDDWIKEQSKGF